MLSFKEKRDLQKIIKAQNEILSGSPSFSEKRAAQKTKLDALKRLGIGQIMGSDLSSENKQPSDPESINSAVNDSEISAEQAEDYYLREIEGKSVGEKINNTVIRLGDMPSISVDEIAKILGLKNPPSTVKITGRTLKHADERRHDEVKKIVPNLKRFFIDEVTVLPNYQDGNKILLVHNVEKTESNKNYVAVAEIEVKDDAIYIVTLMTMPDRTLKKAIDLKSTWQEGQQTPLSDSPHPVDTEASHAEADFPNVPPVGSTIAQSDEKSNIHNQGGDTSAEPAPQPTPPDFSEEINRIEALIGHDDFESALDALAAAGEWA